jgi:DNA polymerase III epsilon subunit-like protein
MRFFVSTVRTDEKMKYLIDNNTDVVESALFKKTSFDHFIKWLEDKDTIGLDTETTGLDCHKERIIMLQVTDDHDVFVLDTRGTDYLKRLVGKIEDKLVIGQNLKFDYKFLKREGIFMILS